MTVGRLVPPPEERPAWGDDSTMDLHVAVTHGAATRRFRLEGDPSWDRPSSWDLRLISDEPHEVIALATPHAGLPLVVVKWRGTTQDGRGTIHHELLVDVREGEPRVAALLSSRFVDCCIFQGNRETNVIDCTWDDAAADFVCGERFLFPDSAWLEGGPAASAIRRFRLRGGDLPAMLDAPPLAEAWGRATSGQQVALADVGPAQPLALVDAETVLLGAGGTEASLAARFVLLRRGPDGVRAVTVPAWTLAVGERPDTLGDGPRSPEAGSAREDLPAFTVTTIAANRWAVEVREGEARSLYLVVVEGAVGEAMRVSTTGGVMRDRGGEVFVPSSAIAGDLRRWPVRLVVQPEFHAGHMAAEELGPLADEGWEGCRRAVTLRWQSGRGLVAETGPPACDAGRLPVWPPTDVETLARAAPQ